MLTAARRRWRGCARGWLDQTLAAGICIRRCAGAQDQDKIAMGGPGLGCCDTAPSGGEGQRAPQTSEQHSERTNCISSPLQHRRAVLPYCERSSPRGGHLQAQVSEEQAAGRVAPAAAAAGEPVGRWRGGRCLSGRLPKQRRGFEQRVGSRGGTGRQARPVAGPERDRSPPTCLVGMVEARECARKAACGCGAHSSGPRPHCRTLAPSRALLKM